MPSARLVFNDDATVLGPVLERTGEMIKAATSDIPRLRLGQEQFAHGQSMDLANLKMRQAAFQAEQDNALMGNLFGPGAAGSARTRSSAGSLSSVNLPQMRFDYQQQRDAQRQGDARRKELEKGLQERRKYQAELEAEKSMSPISGQFIPKYSPEEIQKLVGIRYPRELDESDPALQPEAFSSYPESPLGARGDAPARGVDGGLLSMEQPSEQADLLAQQRALDLQRKRAAFVRIQGDPALQQRMGIDEYRLNELYRTLWPAAQGAPEAAPAAGADLPPLTIQAEGALEAPAPAALAPAAPTPGAPAGFRTPDELRIAEHHRASEVDAAVKALVAKAAADPDANLDPIRFLVNEQDSSGGMQRTPDLRDLLSLGQLSNLFTTGSMHPGLPEWLGGPKPMPRLSPRAAAQTPQQRLAEVVDPLQGNANFTNRLSIGQR